jgi:hypothetical protein
MRSRNTCAVLTDSSAVTELEEPGEVAPSEHVRVLEAFMSFATTVMPSSIDSEHSSEATHQKDDRKKKKGADSELVPRPPTREETYEAMVAAVTDEDWDIAVAVEKAVAVEVRALRIAI